MERGGAGGGRWADLPVNPGGTELAPALTGAGGQGTDVYLPNRLPLLPGLRGQIPAPLGGFQGSEPGQEAERGG